jgi:hypothetical protein
MPSANKDDSNDRKVCLKFKKDLEDALHQLEQISELNQQGKDFEGLLRKTQEELEKRRLYRGP